MTRTEPVRTRPRSQPRELHAADAAVADRARRLYVSRTGSRSSTASAATPGRRPTRGAAGSRRRWRRPGIGVGDTVALMAANTPEMVEAHFGVPMTRRRAQHAQHAARRGRDRLHARARRGEGAGHRHRVLADDRAGAGAARRRSRSSIDIVDALGPGGKRLGDRRLRGVHRRRRSGVRLAAPGGRVGRDLAQLHVGHDRQSEGRGLPPPRRLPQRAVEHHRLGDAPARGLPVDAADVPLQRLVLPLDDGRQRRRQRLPAQGRGEGDLRRDPRAQGHALLRRADRAPDARSTRRPR